MLLRADPVLSRPRTSVKPVRLHFYDDDQRVNVSRTVGYRARCRCGWFGKVRRKWGDAIGDAREHREGHE